MQGVKLHQNPFFIAIGLFAMVFLCFVPSLQSDWVNWDDPTYVLNNPLITSESIQWSAIWEQDQILGIYHPLTLLSYAIDYQIWGLDPYGYHLTNIVFHAFNASLVFLVFRKLRTSIPVAVIIALFFGIHPMHVESVSWISERKDVLYVFFLLLAWLSYLNFRKKEGRNKWIWYFLILFLFSCSILSKPIAFVFPAVLILSDYYLDGKFSISSILKKTPVITMAIVAIFIAQWGQADSQSISSVSDHPVPTLFYGSYNTLVYLFKAIVPINLSVFHPFPLDDSMNAVLYLSMVPFAGVLWTLYWTYRKAKPIFFGLAFFLVTIAPLLQIIPFGKTLTSERYTYLPYLGVFFVMAYLLENFFSQKLKKAQISFGILAALLTFISTQQQYVWKNSESLWTSVIQSYPDAYFPYLSRGRYYTQNDQPQKAWNDFQKSIALHPTPEAYYEIGLIQEERGETNAALKSYLSATKGKIPYAKAHMNAATIYGKLGNRVKAKYHVKKALEIDPEYSLARFNYAIILKIEGDLDKALHQIEIALKLEPGNIDYLEMRAAIFTDLNKHQEAIRDFKRVLSKNPKNGRSSYYLGMNYLMTGDTTTATGFIIRASELGYQLPSNTLERLGIKLNKN